MRTPLLSSLTLAISAVVCAQAYASSDDSCSPSFSMLKKSYDACSNLPFLSPGNDSQINLRLLLANNDSLQIAPNPLTKDDRAEGYGEVPFANYRLDASLAPPSTPAADDKPTADEPQPNSLNDVLAALNVKRDDTSSSASNLIHGEGSRCISNDNYSALLFVTQVKEAVNLSDAERQALAGARMQMLLACDWEPEQLAALLPTGMNSASAKELAQYLKAAGDFYSGRFDEAKAGFTAVTDSALPWLHETATYMVARTELNIAQADAFTEYDELDRSKVDQAALKRAEAGFTAYVDSDPFGYYSTSATGLLRRVHWLGGDNDKLAADYQNEFFATGDNEHDEATLNDLVLEADVKLITPNTQAVKSFLVAALNDLMWMREQSKTKLTRAQLLAQKATFAEQPELFNYLQAAQAFYVENDPDAALKLLPAKVPEKLGYLAFSQQTLRGLALEAKQDLKGAEALWLQLMPLAELPLQHEQLELALAMNYERDQQLAKVFAEGSPIKSEQVRYTLLRQVADADLLRQQVTKGVSDTERNTALFVLLYKDVMRSQYAAFAEDIKRLPAKPPEEKLGYSLGDSYSSSNQSLALFQWNGDKAESGYACPSTSEVAAILQKDAKDPHGLLCQGEFILRNGLDGMSLDQRRNADRLGGTAPGYAGEVFSRLDGYKQVIANTKAPHKDQAYALFRAINCYAPSGNNSCGGKEVEPSVRKGWFRQLKTSYADTSWGKSLQFYW